MKARGVYTRRGLPPQGGLGSRSLTDLLKFTKAEKGNLPRWQRPMHQKRVAGADP
jgi:hypothetical protein